MQITTHEQFIKYINRTSTIPKGTEGSTPHVLVNKILDKLDGVDWKNPSLRILDPCFGFGTFLFYCYIRLRKFHSEKHILNNMLYGIEREPFRYQLSKTKFQIKNLYQGDFLNPTEELLGVLNMKFDCIVGNPPYQQQVGPTKTSSIWDKFVTNAFRYLKKDGHLALVHPAGWRNVEGRFFSIRDLLLSKSVEYLEIHNEADGLTTFGAKTRYDWYVVKNTKQTNFVTKVKFENGVTHEIDLRELPFIPNHSYEKIKKLIANPGEDTVEVIQNSAYYSRGKNYRSENHVSWKKTSKFRYPVIYHVNKDETLSLQWSSDNTKGHYGIPKLVWIPNARLDGTGYYLDLNGDYALSQFAIGLVDSPSNLKKIYKVFQSQSFKELISSTFITFGGINKATISTFRKDFWKEFV